MPATFLPHVPTLALSTVFVTAILGALLLCTWLQDRRHRALLWWGPVYFMVAAGMALLALRGVVPNFLSIEIANALLILATGGLWAGARVFEGRTIRLTWPLAPALAVSWIVACQFGFFAGNLRLRIVACSLALGALLLLTAWEFWRGRRDSLMSRLPAIVVLTAYGTTMLLRIPVVHLVALPPAGELFQSPWFGVMSFATLLWFVTLAFIMLAMTKERAELRHKRAALVDPLTGLLNRRAFIQQAEACLLQLQRGGRPGAALVFDLDAFKQINDRFGHPVGDRVLKLFSVAARAEMRGADIVGRIGGEEFAALLPDCDEHRAHEVAEHIRKAFAQTAATVDRNDLRATVSIGVASLKTGQGLGELLAAADRAVYRAKDAGRNRVRGAAEFGQTQERGRTNPPLAADPLAA